MLGPFEILLAGEALTAAETPMLFSSPEGDCSIASIPMVMASAC